MLDIVEFLILKYLLAPCNGLNFSKLSSLTTECGGSAMETRIAHGMRLDWLLKLLHKARRDKLLFGGKRQCSEPEMGRAELSSS